MTWQGRGFTLLELLVVISIIALLASVIMVSVSNARGKARDAERANTMRQIQHALELYASDHNGQYPATTGWAGVDCGYASCNSQAGFLNAAVSPYLPSWPHDPIAYSGAGDWGYQLFSSTNFYILVAFNSVENACKPKALVGGYNNRSYVLCGGTVSSYYCPGDASFVNQCP